jgi:hypothetical protein
MGATLAQFASVYLSVENTAISQNVYALLTHGGPRVGNARLAASIASGVDVPYINFIMYRDLVPHTPARLFGFKHASRKLIQLYLEPSYEAELKQGDYPPYEGRLRYKQYVGSDADDEFSSSLAFFTLSDHLKYYLSLDSTSDLAACGGLEDKFFLNRNAISMYN